jgi:hypothetical protein
MTFVVAAAALPDSPAKLSADRNYAFRDRTENFARRFAWPAASGSGPFQNDQLGQEIFARLPSVHDRLPRANFAAIPASDTFRLNNLKHQVGIGHCLSHSA